MTLEQQIYDFIAALGGRVRGTEICAVLGLDRKVVSTTGKRLAKRGAVRRSGMTWQVMYQIVGPRPTDRRGVNSGSRSHWYGINGKRNLPGNDYPRRGLSKPKPAGELWTCWR